MKNFCIFCGSELKNGMCECSGFKAYYGSISKEDEHTFCIYCGKMLASGEVCPCQLGVAADTPTPMAVESVPQEKQFCIYCGKMLDPGEVCDCGVGIINETPAEPIAPAYEAPVAPVAAEVPYASEMPVAAPVYEAPVAPVAAEVPYAPEMPVAAPVYEAPAASVPTHSATEEIYTPSSDYPASTFGAPLPYTPTADSMTEGSIKTSMKAKAEMDSKTAAEMQAGKKFFNKADDLD